MSKREFFSLSILLGLLSASLGCEDFEDAFGSDKHKKEARGSDVCSKANGSGDCVPYEAEDRTGTSGCTEATNRGGYSGSGFMDYGGNGSWIEWNNVAAPIAGEYTLTFRYANGSAGNRQAAVLVGGQQKGTVPFSTTGSWKTWKTTTLKISLSQGNNTIRVQANGGSGGPNLDNMLVVGKNLNVEDDKRDNIARGKPTRQSSTASRGDSSRAVDGNTSGRYGDGSITHTANEPQPWWRVDLGSAHRVQSVTLFNRTDCCSDRLSDFNVDLLDQSDRVISTKYHQGQAGAKTDVALSATGVYSVRVSLRGTNPLSLAEVQVFGSQDSGGYAKCAEADEHKNATLSCPSGEKIARIDFASYGLPTGSCNAGFQNGSCHLSSSKSKVEAVCLNQQSCTVSASNGTFGDPCPGKFKRIAIAYTCSGGGVSDQCPDDPNKTAPGICGCGMPDTDSDGDGSANCIDDCPSDPNKTAPGECGCGAQESICNPDKTWESEMVYYDNQGNLQYTKDEEGNRIPDFGYVGYKYGADPPQVKVVHTISPVSGDNTKHIQDAIDHVAKTYSKDSRGFRGALILRPGTYRTDNIIYVPHDGVVIRGSGRGNNPAVDTIIRSTRTGTDSEVFRLGHRDDPDWAWTSKFHSSITEVRDSVIPVGERSFNVQNSSPYKNGDVVVLYQKFNEQWLADVDDGGTVNAPGWTERGFDLAAVYVRQVESKSGSRITLDAPIYYKLDRKYGEITLYRHNDGAANAKNYRQIGIENLRIDIETEPGNIFDNDHTQHGISFTSVIDGWARDVTVLHFSEAAIGVKRSMRITIDRCEAGPAVAKIEGGRRSGYSIRTGGQQVLIRDSSAIACRHGFVLSGATKSSGVVVLRGELIDNIASSEGGHQQWSSGVLFDNCKVTSRSPYSRNPHITFLLGNRGDFGTSHGWSSVNSVMWNTDSGSDGIIVVQKPPTAQNWAIGCTGNINDQVWFPGEFGYEEPGPDDGRSLHPASLYEAQRADRQ